MLPPLKKTQIFGYSIGDLGINLNFQMVGFYLAYFYTDVFGLKPAHVTILFLVARIWDAVNDPLMGYISDHTRSRWGKFRPYLLFCAVPLNVLLIACFFTPEFSYTGKLIYAYVTYILQGMLFTAVGLPYSSINAVMTQDSQERSVISSWRMFFAVVMALGFIAIFGKPIVGLFETEQKGFFFLAIILGVSSTALLWLAFTQSEERVEVARERYGVKDIVTILFGNRELWVLALAMLLNTGVWVIGNTVALYYFKYILHNADLQSLFFRYMIPCNVVGVIVTPYLTRLIGKHKTFILGSIIVAIFSFSRYFVPDESLILIFALSMVSTVGMMFCSVTQWAMLPDTIEYGQWKTGVRSEGIPYAFFSFMQKAGMALAGSFATYVMARTGYEANTDLVPAAEEGIRWLFNIVPAVCSLLCLFSLFFYRLNEARYKEILTELNSSE
ncbi:MAG: MFS transporter [Opitutales bacterium]|nr:MFS transporter [Opitutales bacterium]